MIRKSALVIAAALAAVICLPAVTLAQSSIVGLVRDASGGVLPGVTVEAASPALIEKAKTTVTDGAGQYRIVDLRPGTYIVTFTLAGFQSVRREGVELPSDFTMTINSDLRVGAIEETLTVSGAAPVVDVQSAARVAVLDRDAIDNIPTGRTIQSLGQLIPSVNLSLPDVGGSRAAMQTYMSVRGQGAAQNTIMVDGMVVNGLEANGAVQGYFNDAASEQMTYQTSGATAERSGGGVTLNMVPREGGNRFSGGSQLAARPGAWQGDNLTDRLKQQGLQVGNSTDYIFDMTISEGGPIMRDRLWFYGTFREYRTKNGVSNTFFDDGSQGKDLNYIRQGGIRLTWQLSSRNKLSAFYDRVDKYRSHDMQSNEDPETASQVWTAPNYSTGSVKLTSTVTSKLLVEAGYSQNVEYRDVRGQDGIQKERGTAEWLAGASRTVTTAGLGVRSTAPTSFNSQFPLRKNIQASASYVTGSHLIKAGVQWQWGSFRHWVDSNGDLTQRYASFVKDPVTNNITFLNPDDVILRNTPVYSRENLNADLGLYVQDSWRFRRLTVNGGIRWEYLNASVAETSSGAGRFVPERTQIERKDVPNWKDWAPRFQVIYDVFGNAKTAVKFSINRYNRAQTTSLAAGFNSMTSVTSTARDWTDLDDDDIAEGTRDVVRNPDGTYTVTTCVYLQNGCEINFTGLPANFGLTSESGTFNQFPRVWNLETGIEVQHELLPRLSVTWSYFRGADRNLTKTINRKRQSIDGDYTKVTLFHPVTGEPFIYYNPTAAYNARPDDNFTYVEPENKSVFDTYVAEWRWRPYGGAQVFGGFSWERNLTRDCDTSEAGLVIDPNSLRFCDEWDPTYESPTGIVHLDRKPFALDFRLGASLPLPWGIQAGVSLLLNDEGSRAPTFLFGRLSSHRYPDGSATYLSGKQPAPACPGTCPAGQISFPSYTASTSTSIGLYPGGTVDAERLKQVDLKFSKTFRYRTITIAPTIEAFNITNQDMVITYASQSYAAASGLDLVPNSVLQGRIIGFGANVKW